MTTAQALAKTNRPVWRYRRVRVSAFSSERLPLAWGETRTAATDKAKERRG